MTETEISGLLERAAKEIERSGWCQGELSNEKGERCIFGSVMKAMRDSYYLDPPFSPAEIYKELSLRAQKMNAGVPIDPTSWNDMPGQTKENVLLCLRRSK